MIVTTIAPLRVIALSGCVGLEAHKGAFTFQDLFNDSKFSKSDVRWKNKSNEKMAIIDERPLAPMGARKKRSCK